MTPGEKNWIDNASYEELLEKWRRAPWDSPWFKGKTRTYFYKAMEKKRNEFGIVGECSNQ